MKQITIASTLLLFLFSCATDQTDNTDVPFTSADTTLVSHPETLLDSLANGLINNWKNFVLETDSSISTEDSTGLKKYKSFVDRTTNKYEQLFINIYGYNSEAAALKAFWQIIDKSACCIPNEDLIKLKKFEDLKLFKNRASKIIYSDNLVIEMYLGAKIDDNNELNSFVDKFLNKNKSKKLEIGSGGPAIWTRK